MGGNPGRGSSARPREGTLPTPRNTRGRIAGGFHRQPRFVNVLPPSRVCAPYPAKTFNLAPGRSRGGAPPPLAGIRGVAAAGSGIVCTLRLARARRRSAVQSRPRPAAQRFSCWSVNTGQFAGRPAFMASLKALFIMVLPKRTGS